MADLRQQVEAAKASYWAEKRGKTTDDRWRAVCGTAVSRFRDMGQLWARKVDLEGAVWLPLEVGVQAPLVLPGCPRAPSIEHGSGKSVQVGCWEFAFSGGQKELEKQQRTEAREQQKQQKQAKKKPEGHLSQDEPQPTPGAGRKRKRA